MIRLSASLRNAEIECRRHRMLFTSEPFSWRLYPSHLRGVRQRATYRASTVQVPRRAETE